MAEKSTFIKLDRNILKWRWWHSGNTLQVFVWLLLNANTKDHDFEAETIKRGQIATSTRTIAEQCTQSYAQVRCALNHLVLTGEITISKRPHYVVITIVGYSKYQDVTSSLTSKQQANDKQMTSKSQQYKNNKNIKNGKNIYKGRSAPPSPPGGSSGDVDRWNNGKSDRMKPRDMGTADDIPERYRDRFTAYSDYWDWRNQ